ncbi:MAG: substrate-binding domain-containing protein, partial [Actinomycetota bacterium]
MRLGILKAAKRRQHLGAAAVLAAAAAFAVSAPGAQAAFTSGQCLGSDTSGQGASFAVTAEASWKLDFQNNYCLGAGVYPNVTYTGSGSGAGRRSLGERGTTVGNNSDGALSRTAANRFAGSDEPPNPTQTSQINGGIDATGDEGLIHVIPAATGAVTLIVNFPNNCDVHSLPAGNQTAASASNYTDRVRFTATQLEEIWYGDSDHDTWGEIFPDLAAIVGNAASQTDAGCRAQAIKRVKRYDDSGSTFVFKDYLSKVNPTRGWLTTYMTADSRTWPNTGTNLVDGGASGGGSLSDTVNSTDGSLGYVDLATARSKNFGITATTTIGSRDDDKYWTQVANTAGTYREPTADADGYSNSNKGANCTGVTWNNVPTGADPTLESWASVSGVNSVAGYAICTITYLLAFDDNATVWGNSAGEEAKARSVKDYVTSAVSAGGQAVLFPNDYGPLSLGLRTAALVGANAIGWNKAGDAVVTPPDDT